MLYERRLLNEQEVRREAANAVEYPHDITLQFSNADGFFTSLLSAGEEFRGKKITLSRYEPDDLPAVTFEITAMITDFNILPDIAEFTASVFDPDPLQTLLPKKAYETSDWSNTPPAIINPPGDLGKPYSLCFGRCSKVPLRYVRANYTSDFYDYIIGAGVIESSNGNKSTTVNVYRNKRIVAGTEYYLHAGETAIQFTDAGFGMTAGAANPYIKDGISYAFIRFKKEQRDFGGSLYELHADVRGLRLGGDSAAARNFARVIQHVLSNASWGLGLAINAASFDTAAGQTASMLCDGHVSEQQKAQDLLSELLSSCAGRLTTDSSGAVQIEIDVYQPVAEAAFGMGDGEYENIIEIESNRKTSTREAMKSIEANYRKNEWTGDYAHKNKRAVSAFGEDKTVELNFVRDHVTADRLTCYMQRRQQYGDHQMSITAGMEARFLKIYSPVRIVIPVLNIDSVFQVQGVTRRINTFHLQLMSYSPDMYTYAAGTLPADPNADDETDYSSTPPDAPTSLVRETLYTTQASDGRTSAVFELSAIAPSKNFAKMFFGSRVQGETIPYSWQQGQLISGQAWRARIDGLVPGISYQVAAVSENMFGLRSAVTALSSQLAPGDTTLPAQVTGMTGRGKYKTWEFSWTANTEKDLRGYQVQIGNSNFSTIHFDRIVDQNKVSYTDDAQSYGTLYCRVRAVDFTGNLSASWSSTASATTAQVDTPDIGGDRVTTPKRQLANSASYFFSSIPAYGYGGHTITHGLGRVPIGLLSSSHAAGIPYITGMDSTSFTLCVANVSTSTIDATITCFYW